MRFPRRNLHVPTALGLALALAACGGGDLELGQTSDAIRRRKVVGSVSPAPAPTPSPITTPPGPGCLLASTLREGLAQRGVAWVGHGWGPPTISDSVTVAEAHYNGSNALGATGEIWKGPGSYDWSRPDLSVAYQASHPSWSVRSGQLLYGTFLGQGNVELVPAWLRGPDAPTGYGTPTVTPAQLSQHLHDFLAAYIGRYGTRFTHYELGNELIAHPGKDFYYQNSSIGAAGGKSEAQYLDQLVRWAKAVNPAIAILYNDAGQNDTVNNAGIVTRYRAFVDELRALGTPLDGLGFQCHLDVAKAWDFETMEASFAEFAAAGFDIHVTEAGVAAPIDGAGDVASASDALAQANLYRRLVRAFLSGAGSRARSFGTWGTRDRHSPPLFDPGGMLFDTRGSAKVAFTEVMAELNDGRCATPAPAPASGEGIRFLDAHAGGASGTTTALPPFTAVEGAAIVVSVAGGNVAPTRITDTAGNTYVQVGMLPPPQWTSFRVWVAEGARPHASNVITVTFPEPSTGCAVGYAQYANARVSDAVDLGAGQMASGASSIQTPVFTPGSPGETVVAFAGASASTTWAAGTGYTKRADSGWFIVEDRLDAPQAAQTASASVAAPVDLAILAIRLRPR